jgi:hypothetical protein
MSELQSICRTEPFNGPIEIGLRTLVILTEAFPAAYSLQRLVISDYLVVHSDDADGPQGLHPQTPRRSGELLVRRESLQRGLLLYQSRGLIERRYEPDGIMFAATEASAAFVDVLESQYVSELRSRAEWLVSRFKAMTDKELDDFVEKRLGIWGAEFEFESVLWEDVP